MISINILTMDNWDILHDTLHVLVIEKEALKPVETEIIIVDNGSRDDCKFWATIKNKENLGISVGKNQGIRASKGEYIMLLDGDVIPVLNSVKCLYEYMETHPEVDALGFHANKWSNQRNKGAERHHEDFCHQLVEVKENTGHCCFYGMYRRRVFDQGAMFDERYGVGYGYEDLDHFKEMEKRGIKQYACHINHKAGKYFHDINSSVRVMGEKRVRKLEAEREALFNEKWGLCHVG